MLGLITRRLALGLVTVWLVSVIIFLGVEALPGDACTAILERDAHGEALAKCREAMGLDTPALARYVEWAVGVVQGDFGMSAGGQESIAQMVGYRVRNSLLLAAGALAVGIPLAISLGVIAGLTRDRWPDLLVSTGAILAMTIPEFVAATVLILVFAIWLGWVPAIVLTPADAPPLEFFPEFILASTVLTMLMIAHVMRMIRASVIEAMASEYVQMATLKGVPYWRTVFRHALPNALSARDQRDRAHRRVAFGRGGGRGGGVQLSRIGSDAGRCHFRPRPAGGAGDHDDRGGDLCGREPRGRYPQPALNPRLRSHRARQG